VGNACEKEQPLPSGAAFGTRFQGEESQTDSKSMRLKSAKQQHAGIAILRKASVLRSVLT